MSYASRWFCARAPHAFAMRIIAARRRRLSNPSILNGHARILEPAFRQLPAVLHTDMAHSKTSFKPAQAAVLAGGLLLSAALFAGSFYVGALRALALLPLAAYPAVFLWYQSRGTTIENKVELDRLSAALNES